MPASPAPAAPASCPTGAPHGLFVRLNRLIYPEIMDYLSSAHGFDDLVLLPGDNALHGVGRYLSALKSLPVVLANLARLREADVIFSAPKNVSYILKAIAALGLIRPKLHLAYGFFAHSKQALKLFRLLSRLDRERDVYTMFSKFEQDLYGRAVGVPKRQSRVVYYSDWDRGSVAPPDPGAKSGRYVISAGYSNRDYKGMVALFRELPEERLVIVCSAINHELDRMHLPPNITVERDLPIEAFDRIIAGATACVLAIKNRKGPAGTSVVTNCLKHGTPVIITETPVIREYIEHGVSGYVVDDLAEVPSILAGLDPASPAYEKMVAAGFEVYRRQGSFAYVTGAISAILAEAGPGRV